MVRTCKDLRQALCNEGYMQSEVIADVEYRGKKAHLTYWLQPGKAYYIGNLNYVIDDKRIDSLLKEKRDSSNRVLKVGMRFDLAKLDSERKRLTSLLNNNASPPVTKTSLIVCVSFIKSMDSSISVLELCLSKLPISLRRWQCLQYIGQELVTLIINLLGYLLVILPEGFDCSSFIGSNCPDSSSSSIIGMDCNFIGQRGLLKSINEK